MSAIDFLLSINSKVIKYGLDRTIALLDTCGNPHKQLKSITKEQIHSAFHRNDLIVFSDSQKLEKYLQSINWKNQNLLMMSSGDFNGINLKNLIK